MPSSRKRNKGKERKAKQTAKKEETERLNAHGFWRSNYNRTGCDHGYDVVISEDQMISNDPISNFVDQFIMNVHDKSMLISINLRNLFQTHRQIWNNKSYRKLALNVLICAGTNMLLDDVPPSVKWSVWLAQGIVVLEHYDGLDNINAIINKHVVSLKWRDLDTNFSSHRRDCLKFFRKRTSCKCLKRMHLEARISTPKTGKCYGCDCDKVIERSLLSVCSKCMIAPYCSRECQVAHWPNHKKACEHYVLMNNTQPNRKQHSWMNE